MRTLLLLLLVTPASVWAITGIRYYHADALGSPVAVTDELGVVVWRARYRPFGDRDQIAAYYMASLANPVWFTRHTHDEETGLAYMQARFYSPALGRFMTPDPAAFDATRTETFNRYAYARNNPYRYVDPDGRESVLFTLKGSVVTGAGASSATGIYVTFPTGDGTRLDAGLLTTASVAAGADVSATANLSIIRGGRAELDGPQVAAGATLPLTGVAGPAVDVEYLLDPETGQSLGSSIGVGVSAMPSATASVGASYVTFSIRDTFFATPEAPVAEQAALELWYAFIAN